MYLTAISTYIDSDTIKYHNYTTSRRRGGVLNSPRFCFFLSFFSVPEVGTALMGDTAGHKPHEPTL